MAITIDDFNKIWASTSPLTPYSFSESNYKEGWNFIGATPPSRQMWDSIQKTNDEKTQWLYLNVVQGIPIGVVQAFAGATTPQGWLLCDGSAVSRTDYADLYAVIGDTYGAGDGVDTFNLPNLTDKFIQGNAVAGTEHSAGLPNITGELSLNNTSTGYAVGKWINNDDGALQPKTISGANDLWVARTTASGSVTERAFTIDASRSSSIYGNSATVQPPALTMQYIIKY